MEPRQEKRTRVWLEKQLKEFHKRDFLSTDPLCFVHRYQKPEDQEVVAWISALFSFGSVPQILKAIEKILTHIGPKPHSSLMQSSCQLPKQKNRINFYRFYSHDDVNALLRVTHLILKENKSLGQSLRAHYLKNRSHLENLGAWRKYILHHVKAMSPGIRFMFPNPEEGAAKRIHLLLRWLVRKDHIDLGLWNWMSPKDLILPLDTHLFDISKNLKLTTYASPSLKAACQITEQLKKWEPQDPLKYDFALCRIGVLGLKNIKSAEF